MTLFEDVHRHRKTHHLAARISAVVTGQSRDSHVTVTDTNVTHHAMPPWMCAQMVVAQLHRLICWCARESGSGLIGDMEPYCFAEIIGWRDPATEGEVFDAWMSSGFIDEGGSDSAKVHEFESYAAALNSARDRKRAQRARDAGREASPGKTSATETESRDSHVTVTDKSRDSHRRVRDPLGMRNEERGSSKKKEKSPRSARPARPGRAAPKPPAASIEPEPEPQTAVAVIEAPSEVAVAEPPPGKAPTSAWVDEWSEQLQRRGMPDGIERSQIGGLLKRLRRLWEQWGSDQQADVQVRQVIAAWFDSDWGAQTGYGVRPFLAGGKVNELVAGLLRAQSPVRDRRSEERHRLHMEAGLRGLMEAPASYELDDAALAAITSS